MLKNDEYFLKVQMSRVSQMDPGQGSPSLAMQHNSVVASPSINPLSGRYYALYYILYLIFRTFMSFLITRIQIRGFYCSIIVSERNSHHIPSIIVDWSSETPIEGWSSSSEDEATVIGGSFICTKVDK